MLLQSATQRFAVDGHRLEGQSGGRLAKSNVLSTRSIACSNSAAGSPQRQKLRIAAQPGRLAGIAQFVPEANLLAVNPLGNGRKSTRPL